MDSYNGGSEPASGEAWKSLQNSKLVLHAQGQNGFEPMDNRVLGLTDWSRAFFAGVLAHLPGLLLFTTPSYHSYIRLKPGAWSGAYRYKGFLTLNS